jgi:hypothetical protein
MVNTVTLITQYRENGNKSLICFKAMDYVCVGGGKDFLRQWIDSVYLVERGYLRICVGVNYLRDKYSKNDKRKTNIDNTVQRE